MQLSPLQSRLAASLIASFMLIVIYLFFFFPQFATAAQLDGSAALDNDKGNHGWIHGLGVDDTDVLEEETEATDMISVGGTEYEPEFVLFDRGIVGRAPAGVTGLLNNEPSTSNILPGGTMSYVFQLSSAQSTNTEASRLRELRRSLNGSQLASEDVERPASDDLELARRQKPTKTVWISANTCQQPSRVKPDQTTMDPPQLSLFVSKSSDNTQPGPGDKNVDFVPFNEGAAMFNTTLTEDVFFSIYAPEISTELFDTSLPYNYEVAVSTDQSYHTVADSDDSQLIWVDSDATGALLTTRYLTNSSDQVITTPPYVMYANNKADSRINGIRKSYCGLAKWAQVRVLENGQGGQITTGLRHGGPGNLTKQEFYVGGLNASSQYVGILVHDPIASTTDKKRDVPGGGGVVFAGTEISTKPLGACRVIFNLTLCDETQYAVPANADLFPEVTDLEKLYENYTQTMYGNFEKSLQQVQCEAPSENRYSLVKTCDDCRTAYKNWLCSVAVPRCEDFSQMDREYLQPRLINEPFPNGTLVDQSLRDAHGNDTAWTKSRNPLIDEQVRPGPYKEVLPCDDVCYQLVQSCPASLGLNCPLRGSLGYNVTYGRRVSGDGVSCNYPGSAHYPSAAPGRGAVPWFLLMAVAVFSALRTS